MRRRTVLGALGALSLCPGSRALGQSLAPPKTIALLHPGSTAIDQRIAAIRDGFGSVGESGQVRLITAVGDGDVSRLPALARQLAASRPDVILAVSRPAVREILAAKPDSPIVALDLESDPIESGWVTSLARPAGNLTGIFLDLPGLSAKCLELLREVVPTMRRVGVLWHRAMGSVPLQAVRASADALGLTVIILEVERAPDLEATFASAAGHVDGILTVPSPLFGGHPKLLADLARSNRLATVTPFPDFGHEGGLLAYGPDLQGLFRQAGVLARKIAEGAPPGETPAERPVRFTLVVNQITARLLGLTVPTSLLARADEVIE
jgi:putative ABC transport system substrate-binding protein